MDRIGWAILATGGIAHQFAGGLKESKTGKLVAVGSRSIDKAKEFCEKHGGNAFGSYEEAIRAPGVDAVYIALPHHLHAEWTIRVAEAGKAILCEKPFTLTYLEAKKTLDAIEKYNVFFMEAFMYRCHQQTEKIRQIIADGIIGEPIAIDAEFGFAAGKDWDNFRTVNALGGGALMDVGCYPVSFARMVFASEPIDCVYRAQIGEKGYDEVGVGTLVFPQNRFLHFGTAVHLNMRNEATIHGTKGHLRIQSPWKVGPGSKMFLYHPWQLEPYETFDLSSSNDQLYAFEADAVANSLSEGDCRFMTRQDTLGNMKTLDALRKSAGLHFEGEESR